MHALAQRRASFRKLSPLLLAACLVAAALVPGVAAAANVGFVQVQDGQFVLDGQRFDFVGTVAFALLAGKIYGIESFTHDVIAAAHANGFRAVRTWGYFLGRPESIEPAPRQYNESALRALDWVVKQFDDAGIRLVVPLFGRYENYGGMLTYAQWAGRGPDLVAFYTDPAAKALYKDYVRMLLNRTNVYTGRKYKDEPTILAWELADEPNLPDLDRSGNIFHAWASEMAAFIKSIDGNHLLGTGEEGYDTSPAGYSDVASVYNGNYWTLDGNKGVSYTRNTAIPHIDYGTFKFYPELWLMPNKAASGAAWIRDHLRIARSLGKPAIFSEFGDSASWHADDPSVLNAWLAAMDEGGGGGVQFWQLVAPGWWCDQFCVTAPPATRISDALRAAAVRANSRGGTGLPGAPGLPPPAGPLNPKLPAVDYDGDGKSDIAVYRSTTGEWFIRRSSDSSLVQVNWGAGRGDTAVPADYDGDGKADLAVYRVATSDWFILLSGNGALAHVTWGSGTHGDIPLPGDYDGDRKADVAIYRPSSAEWFILRSSDGGMAVRAWGDPRPGDVPVPADYDGDGRLDLAVYRPGSGEWFILLSGNGALTHVNWGSGAHGDVPLPGDYDGDGRADVAVYRVTNAAWSILRSSDGGMAQVVWGGPLFGDVPAPADYDGDRRLDLAVYRPTSGEWFIHRSMDGALSAVSWGNPGLGDVPAPGAASGAR